MVTLIGANKGSVAVDSGYVKQSIYIQFASVIPNLNERHLASASVCQRSEFSIFGLTDAALCTLCSTMPLLTENGNLAGHMGRKGLNAWTLENLKWLRNQANDAG